MGMAFLIRKYQPNDFNLLFHFVHRCIDEVYPAYYPLEAVSFFHEHHSKSAMMEKLPDSHTLLGFEYGQLVATGTLYHNEIQRMFVEPARQRTGYGSGILRDLEKQAAITGCTSVTLSSSLPSYFFYINNGYKMDDYCILTVKESRLCYFSMSKIINPDH
jgi:GNAT superfamily N-acetyltransferase